MNKNIIKCLILAMGVVSAASCTANYLEINSDPYGTTKDELERDGYIIRSALVGIANGVISPDVNTTQFTECLLGGPMAGYLADANGGWGNTISNYNPTDNWTNVFMQSDKMMPVIYTTLKSLRQVTDDPVILAVGTIIKVAAMHRITDTYGPVPYSKVGQDGKLEVEYDSQETIYIQMIRELTEAVEELMPNRTNNFSSSADVIYGGNTEKWIKFANSLKLRLAMRVSYANPELSKAAAEEAVNNEVGVFSSNDDNIKNHTDQTPCTTGGGDSHVAADIVCYMNGYNDPRREAYFNKSEFDGYDYAGLRRGIVIPDHATVGHKFSGVKISYDSPVCWMNAAEVAFLKAEAAGVFGYNMGGSAKDFYEEGIRLSFNQWGAGDATAYIADNSSVPATYTDPSGSNSYSGVISDITIAWDDAADKETMQERIITQKWIANWLLGNESWAEWRRTGYPHLIPATDAGNKSNGEVDSAEGARRMPYPDAEYGNNPANIAYAVANYLKGPDNMSTKLWFDCK